MERLIKLLNKYEKEIRKSEFYEWEKGIGGATNLFRRDTWDEEGSHIYSDIADTYVISKKFGFIKWLVDNDKIDTNGYLHYNVGLPYESLLMALAIEDNPIEFLLSILK